MFDARRQTLQRISIRQLGPLRYAWKIWKSTMPARISSKYLCFDNMYTQANGDDTPGVGLETAACRPCGRGLIFRCILDTPVLSTWKQCRGRSISCRNSKRFLGDSLLKQATLVGRVRGSARKKHYDPRICGVNGGSGNRLRVFAIYCRK